MIKDWIVFGDWVLMVIYINYGFIFIMLEQGYN